jgi:hypothetical protein
MLKLSIEKRGRAIGMLQAGARVSNVARQYVDCFKLQVLSFNFIFFFTLHRRWTRQQWANVLFSDDSRFTLHSKDDRTSVYRRHGELYSDACVNPLNHFQASVMVWGGITSTSQLDRYHSLEHECL